MAVITQNDIDRAKQDIITIDEFVESNNPTIVTKDGKTIQTLQGITDGINQSQVAVNSADIIVNASAISDNADDIQDNADAIAAITGGVPVSFTEITTLGASVYNTPGGVTGLEVWTRGAGAGGEGATDAATWGKTTGGAGGQGAWSRKFYTPTPSQAFNAFVGTGGLLGPAGNVGGAGVGTGTWFNNATSCRAAGGTIGTGGSAGDGGRASFGFGDEVLDGSPGDTGVHVTDNGVVINSSVGGGEGAEDGGARANSGAGGTGGGVNNGTLQAGLAGANGKIFVIEYA